VSVEVGARVKTASHLLLANLLLIFTQVAERRLW
jgi:hypothetical protein